MLIIIIIMCTLVILQVLLNSVHCHCSRPGQSSLDPGSPSTCVRELLATNCGGTVKYQSLIQTVKRKTKTLFMCNNYFNTLFLVLWFFYVDTCRECGIIITQYYSLTTQCHSKAISCLLFLNYSHLWFIIHHNCPCMQITIIYSSVHYHDYKHDSFCKFFQCLLPQACLQLGGGG